jgi:hypothetical protein
MSVGGSFISRVKPKKVTVSAVVTRADGRVENLGVIAYHHRNPFFQWCWDTAQWFKGRVKA